MKNPILVIEDEPSVTAFLRIALERGGYSVVAASSGAEGLKILADGEFIAVVSDMRTPGGVSGADVFRWVQKNRPDLRDRFIFITGDTVNDETSRVLKETQVPCIEKPFRVQTLLQAISRVLANDTAAVQETK